MSVQAAFPAKLRFFFEPKRYKVAYGGRGSAKSWSAARALLILGAQRKLRIFCGRETQKSITDSVHKLLSDQVSALGLQDFYLVEKATIKGVNGTEIIFAGLKHNISNIKSLESVDIAWIEEAQAVSKGSWEILIPTIRKEGSEIWVTFNPELATDDTYKRFVLNPPTLATVVKANWSDNPWFPAVLDNERRDLFISDHDAYLNVWEGHPRQMLDGAVYASELRQVRAQGRITRVPYDKTKPVHTFWDLGYSDHTAIWFAQAFGFEYRLIDYYDNSQKSLPHYLEVLQQRGYIYGTDWLPHDARAKQLGTGRSIEDLMREAGRRVQITPQLSLVDGINAARTIFSNCWFDEEKCADGLQALNHYRYEKNEGRGVLDKLPLHDWSSHGADAFRYFAIAIRPPKPKQTQPRTGEGFYGGSSHGWMG